MTPLDLHSLFDIVYSAELVIRYTKGVSEEDFSADEKLQDAVTSRLSSNRRRNGRVRFGTGARRSARCQMITVGRDTEHCGI